MYNEHVEGMKEKFAQFVTEAEAGYTNKAAALRARKLSMALRTDLKDFRSLSNQRDKKEID
jgi:hypothetical protein